MTQHLGYHPKTIAGVLLDDQLQRWRTERYLDIWEMMRNAIAQGPGQTAEELITGYGCNKGNHRSVAWQWIESRIFMAMCFEGSEMPLCEWTQRMKSCQRGGEACEECSTSNPALLNLEEVVISEFFEVWLAAEEVLAGLLEYAPTGLGTH